MLNMKTMAWLTLLVVMTFTVRVHAELDLLPKWQDGRFILLDSSVFEAAKYNQRTRTLTLVFQNGYVYQYEEVPRSVYQRFMLARNKGALFHAEIRNVFDFRRLYRATELAAQP
jgi:hypothetical protein